MSGITLDLVKEKAVFTVDKTTKVITDPGTLEKVLKVALYTIKFIGAMKGIDGVPAPLTVFAKVLDDGIEMIGLAQIVPDALAVAETKVESKNVWKLGWASAFLTADIMGLALFLEDYKLFELAEHAAVIGGKHIFVAALNGVAGVGFALLLVDTYKNDWKNADTGWKQFQSILVMARCVTEIAAKTFAICGPQILLFVGITAAGPTLIVVVPIVLGFTSAALGVAHFVTKQL